MNVRDREQLIRGDARRADALAIAGAGVDAVLPEHVISRSLRLEGDRLRVPGAEYDLARYRRIFVAGGGKASSAMARQLESILGHRIADGLVIDRHGAGKGPAKIRVVHAGHPLPTEEAVRGMKEMRELLAAASQGDLVIFLISGGGSALMACPAPGVALEDLAKTTDLLLKAGAAIAEINTIRKHLSGVAGGRLLRWTDGADALSLIVSDVVGDDPSAIASGPTAPDPTTFAAALAILAKYLLQDRVPPRVLAHLESGANGQVPETAKPGDPIFARARNIVVASGSLALEAAAAKARELGYRPLVLGAYIKGESRVVGQVHAGIARGCLASDRPLQPPAALLSGGETTVTVVGNGKGGRNQEFALGFLRELRPGMTVLSIDTDGIDGASDACGAIADASTLEKAAKLGLSPEDALADNDAYNFLCKTGDLIFTGPTGTNVSDLRVVLV